MNWIEFVKDFAKKNKMKYNEALKSPKIKPAWEKHKKSHGGKKEPKKKDDKKMEDKKMYKK